MSYPASEKKENSGAGEVRGFEGHRGGADVVTDMVERHDDHD